MKADISSGQIEKQIDLENGTSLVLFDRLAKGLTYSPEERARNIYLLDKKGQPLWQIATDFDLEGNPFTNIFHGENQQICGYRWDGSQYAIDLVTGRATPIALWR